MSDSSWKYAIFFSTSKPDGKLATPKMHYVCALTLVYALNTPEMAPFPSAYLFRHMCYVSVAIYCDPECLQACVCRKAWLSAIHWCLCVWMATESHVCSCVCSCLFHRQKEMESTLNLPWWCALASNGSLLLLGFCIDRCDCVCAGVSPVNVANLVEMLGECHHLIKIEKLKHLFFKNFFNKTTLKHFSF